MALDQLPRSRTWHLARRWLGLTVALSFAACSGKLDGGKLDPGPAEDPPAKESPTPLPREPESPTRESSHLLQIIEIERATGQVRTRLARRVAQALPRRRASPRGPVWRVETLGQDGRILHEVTIGDPSQLRAEFTSDGQLNGLSIEKPIVTIPLRLPLLAQARRIRVRDAGGRIVAEAPYPEVMP